MTEPKYVVLRQIADELAVAVERMLPIAELHTETYWVWLDDDPELQQAALDALDRYRAALARYQELPSG